MVASLNESGFIKNNRNHNYDFNCSIRQNSSFSNMMRHEKGHVFGIEDQYDQLPTGNVVRKGFENNMMGNSSSGVLTNEQIGEAIQHIFNKIALKNFAERQNNQEVYKVDTAKEVEDELNRNNIKLPNNE